MGRLLEAIRAARERIRQHEQRMAANARSGRIAEAVGEALSCLDLNLRLRRIRPDRLLAEDPDAACFLASRWPSWQAVQWHFALAAVRKLDGDVPAARAILDPVLDADVRAVPAMPHCGTPDLGHRWLVFLADVAPRLAVTAARHIRNFPRDAAGTVLARAGHAEALAQMVAESSWEHRSDLLSCPAEAQARRTWFSEALDTCRQVRDCEQAYARVAAAAHEVKQPKTVRDVLERGRQHLLSSRDYRRRVLGLLHLAEQAVELGQHAWAACLVGDVHLLLHKGRPLPVNLWARIVPPDRGSRPRRSVSGTSFSPSEEAPSVPRAARHPEPRAG